MLEAWRCPTHGAPVLTDFGAGGRPICHHCGASVTPAKYRKVTLLEGFYATGDLECFCFDKVADPWNDERDYEERDVDRIYPGDLLPDDLPGHGYGDWRVTVEFIPKEPS